MQLALIRVAGDERFAVRESDDQGWMVIDGEGHAVRTLGQAVEAVTRQGFTPDAPRVREDGFGAVARGARKILAIGLNYRAHIEETGSEVPDSPVVFAKYPSAVTGPYDPILLDPALTGELDYESELAVVIGAPARRVSPEAALDHVFGYAVANDVSSRDLQRRDSQFSRSKSMDTFCPLGPWITTADVVGDPQKLRVRSFVNGEPRQDSETSLMMRGVAELISYLSQTMTLESGDVILSGTPRGVGLGFSPPRFLQPGDIVRCEIEGLGAIENPVVLDSAARRA